MRTLVTGGTGFIGSHLVERLVAQNRKVRVLVLPQPIETIEIDNLRLLRKIGVEIIYGDLRDKDSLKKVTKNINIVFHLGAISRPMNIPEQTYFDINEDGTKNLLELCLKESITKFIHTSTVSVIGVSPNGHPLKENDFNKPTGPYALSKLKGEQIAINFYKRYSFPVTVVRPSLVYGPRCLVRLIMFRFIKRRLFPIFKDGKSHMEFCYVDNLIDATLLAETNLRSIGEIYNITDGSSYEIKNVVRTIAQEVVADYPWLKMPVWVGKSLGFTAEILGKVFNFYPPFSRTTAEWMSTDMNVYDCSKAKRELKYDPKIDLREGIKRTVKWYRENNLLS